MRYILLPLIWVSILNAHSWFGGGCCGGWWPFFGAGHFVGIILLIGLVYLVFVLFRRNLHSIHHGSSALEILKVRYAKGEITKEEYERLKADLLED